MVSGAADPEPGVLVARDAVTNPRPWVAVYAVLVVALFVAIAKLNLDGAQKLQRQIEELNAPKIER